MTGMWGTNEQRAGWQTLPSRPQITKHSCEEGLVRDCSLDRCAAACGSGGGGNRAFRAFVDFFAYDDTAEGLDMFDALHPRTILAYGMSGRALPLGHGAPCSCEWKPSSGTRA